MFENLLPRFATTWIRNIAVVVIVVYTISLLAWFIFGPYDFTVIGLRIRLHSYMLPMKIILGSAILLFLISTEFKDKVIKTYKRIGARQWAIVLLAFYIAVMALYLKERDYNPGFLVQVGDYFVRNGLLDDQAPVLVNSKGYDGQFFYRLALDPFVLNGNMDPQLDSPAYRHQRIAYPLLAHMITFGQFTRVKYALPIINLAALFLLAFVGISYARSIGAKPLYGLIFAIYAGFTISLLRDLPEPMAILFMISGLILIRKKEYLWAAVFLSVAVLTRETTLIASGAIFVASFWKFLVKEKGRIPFYVSLTPLTVFIIGQLLIYYKWGLFPPQESHGNFDYPLASAIRQVTAYLNGSQVHYSDFYLYLLAGYAALAIAGLWCMFSSRVMLHERIAFLIYLGFAVCFGDKIMEALFGFGRAYSEFYAIGAFIVLSSRSMIGPAVYAVWAGLALAMAHWWVWEIISPG